MFLGLPDNKHKEKPSFLQFKKNALPTDGPTDGRMDRLFYIDARTHLKKKEVFLEMFFHAESNGASFKVKKLTFFKQRSFEVLEYAN